LLLTQFYFKVYNCIFVFNGSTTKEYNFNEAYKFAKFSKNKKHLYGLNTSNSLVDINVLTLLQNDENNTLSSTILTKRYAPKIFNDTELVNFQLLDKYISICNFHSSTFILVPYNDISSWSTSYIESTKLLSFSSEVGSSINDFKSTYNNQFLHTFNNNKINILEVTSTPYIDLKTESDQLISIIHDNEIYVQKAIQNAASKQIHEIDLIKNSSTIYPTNFIQLSKFGLATVDTVDLDIHESARIDMYIKFEDDVQIIPNFTRFLDDAGITIPEKVNVTANSIVSSTIIATKDFEIYSIDDATITINDSAPVKRANVLSGDSITFYVNAANTSSTEKLSKFLINSKIVTWSVKTASSATIYKIDGHVQSDEALNLDNTTVICIDKTTNQQVSTYTTSTDGYFIFNNLVNNRDYLIVGYKNYDSSTKHRILSKTIKAS
jgi:hypothetical protein